jgi:hypothetical protein
MAILTYCSPAALESIIEKGFQVDVDTLPPDTPDSGARSPDTRDAVRSRPL